MNQARTILLGLGLVFGLCAVAFAADEEKTLKGKITCAKCDLKKTDDCTTVIVVKEDNKDVIYYLDEKTGKANHAKICKKAKDGTVTGKVEKKGDKMIVTVKEGGVKFD